MLIESSGSRTAGSELADRRRDTMKVKNRKAVRRLSVKSFKAAGRRNITAAVAIAMTTVLFTALFTIMM